MQARTTARKSLFTKIGHPTRMHSFFPDEISEVVSRCRDPKIVAIERIVKIRRQVSLARDLGADEQILKDGLSGRRGEVVVQKVA